MQNPLAHFLAECTVTETGSKIPQKVLFANFVKWCEVHSVEPITKNMFTKLLFRFPAVQSSPCRRFYTNIRFAGPTELQPDETIYRAMVETRMPKLLPAFDAWVAGGKTQPLELAMLDASLSHANQAMLGLQEALTGLTA
jgi:hypothetical protein